MLLHNAYLKVAEDDADLVIRDFIEVSWRVNIEFQVAPSVIWALAEHLRRAASNQVTRFRHEHHHIEPMINVDVHDRWVQVEKRCISHAEFEWLTVEYCDECEAIIEADQETRPIHPPLSAEDARQWVMRWDLLVANFVECEDFYFSIEARR